MVDIAPFSGYLYDQQKTGSLDLVTAPPYDVISPDAQEKLYAKNPYNVIRLILGKQFPEDTGEDNRYTRSAEVFHEWMANGVLSRDETPAFYVYSQDYRFQGKQLSRIGFFARVKIEDFSTGNICPHEFTLAKAKKDRKHLLEACQANFSPIFGLFSDPEAAIDKKLAVLRQEDPVTTIEDGGVTHRFWRLTDSESIQAISKSFSSKKIYIADGHHRYETALAYHKTHGSRVPGSSHVMMFLTNLNSENMSIYPIHRMIRCPQAFDGQEFLSRLSEFFDIEPIAPDTPADGISSLLKKSGEDQIVFAVTLGKNKMHLLKLKDPGNITPFLQPDEPEDLKVLDVAQLHALVIRHLLHIDTRQSDNQLYVAYTVDIGAAMEKVNSGEFDLAFFVNATKMDQVRELAEKGIRLPQKATYFYPKLLSGLVINKFES
ncbi:MAG: hypothetical protein NPINA01_26970 [Nitrospinaceae bacterium]|nr:MAG: hypothetical protein NPINA01_26970 [Nitrospinaceae bacterium]